MLIACLEASAYAQLDALTEPFVNFFQGKSKATRNQSETSPDPAGANTSGLPGPDNSLQIQPFPPVTTFEGLVDGEPQLSGSQPRPTEASSSSSGPSPTPTLAPSEVDSPAEPTPAAQAPPVGPESSYETNEPTDLNTLPPVPMVQEFVEMGPEFGQCQPEQLDANTSWPPRSSTLRIPSPPATSPAAQASDDRVTLVVRETPIGTVLSMIAEQHGLNVVTGDAVDGSVSLALKDVPLGEALDAILKANGYTWSLRGSLLVVSQLSDDTKLSPFAQGREVRVFDLDFSAASDLDRVVQGLLSPVGKSFIAETNDQDKRRTREQLIVEDLPEYLERIEAYVTHTDHAPQQVLIEAHILQIELDDSLEHGVKLGGLMRIANAKATLEPRGFTDPNASPTFWAEIGGSDLDGILECLRQTTNAKTLASPKVTALNGQQARMQIGSQFGYFVTTTTQTSTVQSVEFLEVGVVLTVTPIISSDGRVMMTVKPEVSGGRINPNSGLPEEDTTEVETTVMVGNGRALVIGGLIQEEETEVQSKVPCLGDAWLIGRLFQRRSVVKNRSEIIVALVPHVLPLTPQGQCYHDQEVRRVRTPLTVGPLCPVDRQMWEAELPDAIKNPINCHHR